MFCLPLDATFVDAVSAPALDFFLLLAKFDIDSGPNAGVGWVFL